MFEIKQAQLKIQGLYLIVYIILAISLVSLGFQILNTLQSRDLSDSANDYTKLDPLSVPPEIIKSNLEKIYIFPNNEDPTIADIIDVEKLREENFNFYKDAVVGDKIIIFNEAGLALIFRVQENKIITVSPIAKTN